jgi:hypothetical protein
LIAYLEKPGLSSKLKKSALWILAKILSKKHGANLNEQYKVLDSINYYFCTCEDYAMKGTISYIINYAAQNDELRPAIGRIGWLFFYNSNICFPSNMNSLYLNGGEIYENKKFFEDCDKINKYITLNEVIKINI